MLNYDVLACSEFIKDWLSLLPEPLIPSEYAPLLIAAVEIPCEYSQRVGKIRQVISFLPMSNVVLLRKLFVMLKKVSDNKTHNGMDILKLAQVFAPVLTHPRDVKEKKRAWTKEELSSMVSVTEILFEENEHMFGSIILPSRRTCSEPGLSGPNNDDEMNGRPMATSTATRKVTLRKVHSQPCTTSERQRSRSVANHRVKHERPEQASLDHIDRPMHTRDARKRKKKNRVFSFISIILTKLKRSDS